MHWQRGAYRATPGLPACRWSALEGPSGAVASCLVAVAVVMLSLALGTAAYGRPHVTSGWLSEREGARVIEAPSGEQHPPTGPGVIRFEVKGATGGPTAGPAVLHQQLHQQHVVC